jgi:hypothetical protein
VLFEPGIHLKMWMIGVAPVMVPTKHPDLLASPYGLLINELCVCCWRETVDETTLCRRWRRAWQC